MLTFENSRRNITDLDNNFSTKNNYFMGAFLEAGTYGIGQQQNHMPVTRTHGISDRMRTNTSFREQRKRYAWPCAEKYSKLKRKDVGYNFKQSIYIVLYKRVHDTETSSQGVHQQYSIRETNLYVNCSITTWPLYNTQLMIDENKTHMTRLNYKAPRHTLENVILDMLITKWLPDE